MSKLLLAAAFSTLGAVVHVAPAAAAWPTSPFAAATVSAAAGDQVQAVTVSDGSGGAFVAWIDSRAGNWDIYATHVVAGALVAGWQADGSPVCTGFVGSVRGGMVLVPGTAGDLYIVWNDARSGNDNVYAQRLVSNGAVAPGWPLNGLALTSGTKNQYQARACADGAGGIYVTWTLEYTPGSDYDVYATRVLPSGGFAGGFAVNGVVINAALYPQQHPDIAPDGSGNAFIAYENLDASNNGLIWAQRLGPGGQRPWGAGAGVQISGLVNNQRNAHVVGNGAGGAIIGCDFYATISYQFLYYVNSSGAVIGTADVQPSLNTSSTLTALGSDARGGAWVQCVTGVNNPYSWTLARVDAGGVTHPSTTGYLIWNYFNSSVGASMAPQADGSVVIAYNPLSPYEAACQAFDPSVTPLWNHGTPVAVGEAPTVMWDPVCASDGNGGAIVVWSDRRSNGTTYDLFANRVDRFGALGDASPAITQLADVPNDQGGAVSLQWTASYLDASPDYPIARYSIWREVPGGAAAFLARTATVLGARDPRPAPGGRLLRAQPTAVGVVYWEWVSDVPARGYPGYSVVVHTTSDSTSSANPLTRVRVEAETASGTPFWDSAPDSGYSIDNLAPAVPAPFTANYSAGATHLHWGANTEPDLFGYRLYRGTTASFVPGASSLVAAQTDTGYTDTGAAGSFYKLSAIDVHGNESGFALVTPSGTSGVGGGGPPRAVYLAAPSPNPARAGATLRFGLPRDAAVSLAIYDVNGRLVRELAAQVMTAGDHAVAWDVRDAAGDPVADGVYFARLGAGGVTRSQRFAVVR